MTDHRVEQLEASVRELATALAELARDRDVAERMSRIVGRHPEPPRDPAAHVTP